MENTDTSPLHGSKASVFQSDMPHVRYIVTTNRARNFKFKLVIEKLKNICFAHSQGDSGGPLMATTTDGRALQVGVTSYGPNCHRAEWTGVYTSVDAFAEWIGFYIADQSQYTWLKLPQGGPGEV